MPNRMLRDWTDSEAVNNLSVGAERFFIRLIMKADDFGRFYATARLLRSYLYPLINEKVKESDIAKFIKECETQSLISTYEVDGKLYLEIREFGQRMRIMKSKYPAPSQSDDRQMSDTRQTSDRNRRTDVSPEVEEEVEEKKEVEEEGEGADARPPIPDEFLGIVIYDAEKAILDNQIVFEAICMKTGKDPTIGKAGLRKYHLHLVEKEQYPKGKKAVFAGFEKWLMNEKNFTNDGSKTNQRGNRTGVANGQDPERIGREGVGGGF